MADSRDKKIDDKDSFSLGEKDRNFDAAGFFGDKQKAHRMGCTCATLIILLALLLAGLITVMVLATRNQQNLNVSSISNGAITSSVAQQIAEVLKNKDKEVIINVSESEINSSLVGSQTRVDIQSDKMVLAGKTLGMATSVELVPKIEDGQLNYDVKSVKIGSLPAPKIVAAPLLGQLRKSMLQSNKELSVINFNAVDIGTDELILKGTVVGR